MKDRNRGREGYKREAYRIARVPRVISTRVPWLREQRVQSVLDLGAGQGRISLYLARQGFTVTALDSSPAAVASLRRQAQPPLSLSVVERNMYDSLHDLGKFNLVIAWRVIHIGNAAMRAKLRSSIAMATTGGGFAIVAAAADDCPSLRQRLQSPEVVELEDNTVQYKSYGAIHIKHYYTREELLSTGMFGSMSVLFSGKIHEQSGHPEEPVKRSYWWVLLKQPPSVEDSTEVKT